MGASRFGGGREIAVATVAYLLPPSAWVMILKKGDNGVEIMRKTRIIEDDKE